MNPTDNNGNVQPQSPVVSDTVSPSEPMPSVEVQAAPLVEEPVKVSPELSAVAPTPPNPASAMTETSSEEVDNGQNG